jgi:hypothetical protein
VTAELIGRAPHPEALTRYQQYHWTKGAGAAAEVKLPLTQLVARAGYRWQEYSSYPYRVYYDAIVNSDAREEPKSPADEHLFALGLGYDAGDFLSFEIGCTQKMYELTTKDVLHEMHLGRRVLASLSVRF